MHAFFASKDIFSISDLRHHLCQFQLKFHLDSVDDDAVLTELKLSFRQDHPKLEFNLILSRVLLNVLIDESSESDKIFEEDFVPIIDD